MQDRGSRVLRTRLPQILTSMKAAFMNRIDLARLAAAGFLLVCAAAASAQTACPVGTPPGSATCGPAPGGGGEIPPPPPRPSGEWLKTWGAVSSNHTGDIGVSSGKMSKREAEEEALRQCATWKTGDCKIDISYRNQCVAAVAALGNRRGGAVARNPTLEGAKTQAMQTCRETSGGECRILLAECSEPIFRKF